MFLPITYEEPSGNGFFQWPLTLTSTQSLCLPGSPFTLSLSAAPRHTRDLSSSTRDQTRDPCRGSLESTTGPSGESPSSHS